MDRDHGLLDGGKHDAKVASSDATSRSDGSLDSGNAECAPSAACLGGVLTPIPLLCLHDRYPAGLPAAGIGQVCLVDPSGTLYVAILRDGLDVTSPGWRSSGYDRTSTLSAEEQARCDIAKATKYPTDGGYNQCNLFR